MKNRQRMKPRILHLILLRHWFDEIASGRKTVEYRRRTPYWFRRLWTPTGSRTFYEVHFRNGYARNAPFMRVEFEYTTLHEGPPYGKSFAIHLGKILEIKNWNHAKPSS